MCVVDDHDVFAFLTHSLVPSTDAVSSNLLAVVESSMGGSMHSILHSSAKQLCLFLVAHLTCETRLK